MNLRAVLSCSAAAVMSMLPAYAHAQERAFDLRSMEASKGFLEFARQAGIQIIVPDKGLRGLVLRELKGTYDVREALRLLLTQTNFEVVSNDDKVVILRYVPGLHPATTDQDAPAATDVNRTASAAGPDGLAGVNLEEVVVTGSRIIREGYESPTPLTVVGAEQLALAADGNVLAVLNALPALSGNNLTTNNSICTACGTVGVQNVNLRSLGGNRALVLLDGKRVVGATYDGTPDTGLFPQQLISRVDIVTGGASAVYGSDAVAGVVNFVLDRQFTGMKGEVSGGLTNYADDAHMKVELSSGFDFGSDDRGHVLLSGQYMHYGGTRGDGGRSWNREGWQRIANPNYTPTNGQPHQLWLPHVGLGTATAGGIIVSGPLKGTAFGQGGTPYAFDYGLHSNPYTHEGDWRLGYMRPVIDLDPKQTYHSLFTRISYDLGDNLTASLQYGWAQSYITNVINHQWLLGGSSGHTVMADNAYLPAPVRAAMMVGGLTSFQIGTWSEDAGSFWADNLRISNRVNVDLDGWFEAGGRAWNWSIGYVYGAADLNLYTRGSQVTSLFRDAIDAVVDPATGTIVCRVTLTNPGSGCRPWNVMGIGVNGSATPYFVSDSFELALVEQTTYSASITGEPFDLWAGPVSVAASFEHRKDQIDAVVDQYSLVFDRPSGNFAPLVGKQSVTEGALEGIVPLARNETWAQEWELSLAARFTAYELAGDATTWKIGSSYTPVDGLKFRVTRSRDIRAPNLQELFGGTNAIGSCLVNDPVLGTTYACQFTLQASNPALKPEKADTTGIGIVLTPRSLEGFAASADYWDVNIEGAILPLSVQQMIDSCHTRMRTEICPNITRNAQGAVTTVRTFPVNLARQNVRGLDLESSYRSPADRMISGLPGELSLHGLMTFYFRNYQDNTFNQPTDRVGENAARNLPYWKINMTATYTADPLTLSLTGRAISPGVIDKTLIECASGCPAAMPENLTVNDNSMPGAFYLDAAAQYEFDIGDAAEGEVFLSVKNMFNRAPPPVNHVFYANQSSAAVAYDVLGTIYRAGIRFRK